MGQWERSSRKRKYSEICSQGPNFSLGWRHGREWDWEWWPWSSTWRAWSSTWPASSRSVWRWRRGVWVKVQVADFCTWCIHPHTEANWKVTKSDYCSTTQTLQGWKDDEASARFEENWVKEYWRYWGLPLPTVMVIPSHLRPQSLSYFKGCCNVYRLKSSWWKSVDGRTSLLNV